MPRWFGPKRTGYGVGPRGWQGWAVTALALAVLAGLRFLFHPAAFDLPEWSRPVLMLIFVAAFIVLMRATYSDEPA